jgi:hypothetical protein
MDKLDRTSQLVNFLSENGLYRNPFGVSWYMIDPSRVLRNQPRDYAAPMLEEETPEEPSTSEDQPAVLEADSERTNRLKLALFWAVIILSTFILFFLAVSSIKDLALHPAISLWPGELGQVNIFHKPGT